MSNDDDQADNAREALASRVAKQARAMAEEDRHAYWDRVFLGGVRTPEDERRLARVLAFAETFGFDLGDPEQVKEDKAALAWMRRSAKRAATLNKRILAWLSAALASLLMLSEVTDHFISIRKWWLGW